MITFSVISPNKHNATFRVHTQIMYILCIGAIISTHIHSKVVATLFFISAHEADLSITVPRTIYLFHYTLNLTFLHTKVFFSL